MGFVLGGKGFGNRWPREKKGARAGIYCFLIYQDELSKLRDGRFVCFVYISRSPQRSTPEVQVPPRHRSIFGILRGDTYRAKPRTPEGYCIIHNISLASFHHATFSMLTAYCSSIFMQYSCQ